MAEDRQELLIRMTFWRALVLGWGVGLTLLILGWGFLVVVAVFALDVARTLY